MCQHIIHIDTIVWWWREREPVEGALPRIFLGLLACDGAALKLEPLDSVGSTKYWSSRDLHSYLLQ